ncbi:hypothetical protein KEM55_002353 [Ascosphaera atra]|nr:hypothetical protein KEM55_002353 [Ascosphaera atra]
MDTGAQRPDAQGTLTPLAQLSPALSNVTNRRVHAVITLVWPYSSARRSLDLLLSEPDYRLRARNGLVKVRFHDESAAELSRLKASIGDHVVLHLEGAQWERHAAKVGILETSIDWELSFRDRLHLELRRNSNTVGTIDISHNLEEPENTPSTPIATPARRITDEKTAPTSDWASPAFTKRLAEFITRRDVPSSPLQEEDGYIPGRGRKRPKFGRPTGEWTFIPEPASPVASPDELDGALNLDKLEEMLIAEDTQRREEEERAAKAREEEEKAGKARKEEEEKAAKAREEAERVSQAQEAPPVSSPTIQAQSTPTGRAASGEELPRCLRVSTC